MNPLRCQRRLVIIVMLAAGASILAGCVAPEPTERPRPTPTPGPPAIRPDTGSSNTFDGMTWTLSVLVYPQGEPTDVAIEWGTGTEAGPFDHVIPMAEDVLDAGRILIQTRDLPPDPPFCLRFTATNSYGSASTPAHCVPGLPSGVPPPSGSGTSPSPAAS
jgi:hypothetical protein